MTERGEFRTFAADVSAQHTGGHQLYAVVWNDPGPSKPSKPRKALIATCSTTLVGAPAVRHRRKLQRDSNGTAA